jgi:hypothetical protein
MTLRASTEPRSDVNRMPSGDDGEEVIARL